ncbi:MAG: hypothetical protein LBP63_02300 [Prevotellaceae bacterium]|jgi:hypothetical protein|nr:hypothetical protein [Prevotellaceae bacterium]
MKKTFIIILAVACLFSCEKIDSDKGIVVNNKKMQDFLIAFYDKNKDCKLSEEEAFNVTHISVTNSQEPIDGLEKFPNLEILYIPSGKFTKLDVSKNAKLRQLHCQEHKLSTIDLSNNPELESLVCDNGELTSLYLNNHPKFFHLSCAYNNLQTLDLRNVPNVITVKCENNIFLRSIILNNNSKLSQLWCSRNSLQLLDLSSCPELVILSCSNNSLTELDLSNNLKITYVDCKMDNKLQTLYLKIGQIIQSIHKDAHTTIVYL